MVASIWVTEASRDPTARSPAVADWTAEGKDPPQTLHLPSSHSILPLGCHFSTCPYSLLLQDCSYNTSISSNQLMDSRGESSRGATPTLLNGSTPPALPPQRTSSATNKRPAVLDLTEQTLGNPTATRGQVERPNSPGQDSSEDLPVIQGQRKRVRTSEEGYRPSTGRKRASATQGSPLNPQNNRIASLSPSMAHRRRAAMENAFEHNPMYDEGMEIFQDPLTASEWMHASLTSGTHKRSL